MGKMLMELREEYKNSKKIMPVEADIENADGEECDVVPTLVNN
jgi:hypothetical protein